MLGDTHARADRTTIATKFLREIKETYKKKHRGGKKSVWIPLAIEEFRQRLPSFFPDYHDNNIPVDEDDMGRVLIKCTSRALEAKMDRVLRPNVYAYPGDETPTYGTAKWKESLEFFLESRDAPTLASELEKHRKEFDKLRKHKTARPPTHMMTGFVKTLVFFQEKLEEAEKGDVLAERLLESLRPINSLKEQWKMLENNRKAVQQGDPIEKVPWDGLELKIVERPTREQQHTKAAVARRVPTYRKPQLGGQAAEHHRMSNKRARASNTSPVMSSFGNPVELQVASLRRKEASIGMGLQGPGRVSQSLATFQDCRKGTDSSTSLSMPFPIMIQHTNDNSSMQHAPRQATNHEDLHHGETTAYVQQFDDSQMTGDVLDFESDFLDHDVKMGAVLPEDWEWNAVPQPAWSPTEFVCPHDDANYSRHGSHFPDDEVMYDFDESTSLSLPDTEKKSKPKGALAPSWIFLKVAAVASLLGLHTLKSPEALSKGLVHKTRPADLPNPVSVSTAPCPKDNACLRVMEAIYPVHPEATRPLIGIPGTCQNWAREWLGSNKDIMKFDERRIRQRYALAVLYCETDGASWNEKELWVSDLHECDWNNLIHVDPCGRQEQLQILRNDGLQMMGTIPPELSMISSLWDISFSDNLLTGIIPGDFAKLSELDTLVLAYNLFRGPLPDFLWMFEDLIHLDISYNFFTGTIPNTLHLSEPSLQQLYLSYNSFTGTIPTGFGTIDWQRLYLDGNKFRGAIPDNINSGNIKELILHNNQLTGTLPAASFATEWTGRRSKLERVTLYENNLEGDVSLMCNLMNDTSIGNLRTFIVDLDKVSCECCSGRPS